MLLSSLSLRYRFLAIALVLCATTAQGAGCDSFVWKDAREGLTATQVEGQAFEITTASGDVVDYCTAGAIEGGLGARCREGWEGPLIFAGSTADANDNGILVLLNEVFYRVCP